MPMAHIRVYIIKLQKKIYREKNRDSDSNANKVFCLKKTLALDAY